MTEKELLEKHSKILDLYNSYIECGYGWFSLIDQLLVEITPLMKKKNKVMQIKEKFGRLAVYTKISTDKIRNILYKYETLSTTYCETCGSGCDVSKTPGFWIKYLCLDCQIKMKNRSSAK